MITVTCFAGEKIAVLGLARSGLAAAAACRRGGARVLAWDDQAEARDRAAERGIAIVPLDAASLAGCRALIISPGIPHRHPAPHPAAAAARALGLPIIGDHELLARTCPEAFAIGVTGTNGKSTTTALIAHILKAAGRRIEAGGNLGTPVLDLEPLGGDGIYVLEMSSYQLELTPSLTFDVAVLLNISPDHLVRHGGMDGYVAAKRNIFRGGPVAVIGQDDAICRAMAATVPISGDTAQPEGVHVADGQLYERGVHVADLRAVASLPGVHNGQNAAAAFAACRAAGLGARAIAEALQSYPGLPHRQELIAVINGVKFVNDSKATNAQAAAKALVCYASVYWIAGGQAKEGGLDGLGKALMPVRHAFLIGEAAAGFASQLAGRVPTVICGTLDVALAKAFAMAVNDNAPDPVVLLSPAAASFDQYQNFEARGEAFRALVGGVA